MSNAVIPLESNPEVFTEFAHRLGLVNRLSFHDVYSLTDKELLSFIPRPSPAVILLFPLTPNYEQAKLAEESSRQQIHDEEDVVWYKQTIQNACGLYALLNTISNVSNVDIKESSKIEEFVRNGKDVTKVEELIHKLEEDYSDAANSGQTDAPDAQDDVNFHFITFVKRDGVIYELDGRRSGPLRLGIAQDGETDDILGEDLFINRFKYYNDLADDENKLNFSLLALAPSFE